MRNSEEGAAPTRPIWLETFRTFSSCDVTMSHLSNTQIEISEQICSRWVHAWIFPPQSRSMGCENGSLWPDKSECTHFHSIEHHQIWPMIWQTISPHNLINSRSHTLQLLWEFSVEEVSWSYCSECSTIWRHSADRNQNSAKIKKKVCEGRRQSTMRIGLGRMSENFANNRLAATDDHFKFTAITTPF